MKLAIEHSEVRFRGRLRALPHVTTSGNSWCVAKAPPLPRSVDVLLTGAGTHGRLRTTVFSVCTEWFSRAHVFNIGPNARSGAVGKAAARHGA